MRSLIVATLMLISIQAVAEIYKWVDEKGRTHYSDSNETPSAANAKKLDINSTYRDHSSEDGGYYAKKVIMFSAAWCGFCDQARRYFVANKIPFTEYDIEKNKHAYGRYKRLGGNGLPLILFKDRRMKGFGESRFRKMYRNGE